MRGISCTIVMVTLVALAGCSRDHAARDGDGNIRNRGGTERAVIAGIEFNVRYVPAKASRPKKPGPAPSFEYECGNLNRPSLSNGWLPRKTLPAPRRP